jgi:hypothetical protein
MSFVSRSFFFSVLCLSLMSFSCASESSQTASEPGQGPFEKEFYAQTARANVALAMQVCSGRKLSEDDCEKLKDEYVELGRKGAEKELLGFKKFCQDYRLSEADCDVKKLKRLKEISDARR